MKHSSRLAAMALFLAVVPAAASAEPCSGLSLKIESGGEDAGLGRTAHAYTITNIGPKTCTLDGHPRIEMLDPKGQAVDGIEVEPSTSSELVASEDRKPVELPPGGMAYFAIEFATTGDPDSCRNAVELRATLPGTEMPATFAGSFTVCGKPVQLTPISAGASPLQ